jgi:hypothetical protein
MVDGSGASSIRTRAIKVGHTGLLCVTGENEQPFRKVANRDFGRSRTPISDEVEQSFRLMPNTHFG